MIRLLLALLLLLPVACASSAPVEIGEESVATLGTFDEEDEPASSSRFAGGIRDAFADHVEYSMEGLDFFWRSVTRHTARDWAHLTSILD